MRLFALRCALGLALLIGFVLPARAAPLRSRAPAIEMEHLNTHAVFQLRPDARGGGFSVRQMRALSDFLRCHHTGQRRSMDQRLIALLYATARHYHNAKLWVVAG